MPKQRGKPSQVNDERRPGKRNRKGNKKPGRAQIYGAAYGQLRRDISWLMSMVNVETKYIDVGGTYTLSGAWQLTLLNGLNTGVTSTSRTGQSVKWTGWEFKNYCTINATLPLPTSYRVVVFLDKQPNSTAPTATDVYSNGALSLRVVGNLDRFKVFYEEWFTLDPYSVGAQIESISRKVDFHTMYNTGNVGTIADINTNSFYLMAYSDAGVNFPSFSFSSRLCFVDN